MTPDAADAAVTTRPTRGAGAIERLGEPAWLRIGWPVLLGSVIVFSLIWIIPWYLLPDHLFIDSHIYYNATSTWLAGGNPWTATYDGIPFAGIPPTLLLNLPLIPFGPAVAAPFWVVANTLSIAFLVHRLRLPLWVVLLIPVTEGWLGATPDITLAALLVAGGGWLAALTKPYSAPVLIADRRWRQLVTTAVVGIITIPFLPWAMFYDSRDIVLQAFRDFAGHPVSASGVPILLVIASVAVASLGWRRGWFLFTPALLAQQPHYLVFSLEAVRWSRLLAIAFALPYDHATAVGIVVYAIVARVRGSDEVDHSVGPAPGTTL